MENSNLNVRKSKRHQINSARRSFLMNSSRTVRTSVSGCQKKRDKQRLVETLVELVETEKKVKKENYEVNPNPISTIDPIDEAIALGFQKLKESRGFSDDEALDFLNQQKKIVYERVFNK